MLAETAGLAREVFPLSAAVAGQGSRRLAEVRLFTLRQHVRVAAWPLPSSLLAAAADKLLTRNGGVLRLHAARHMRNLHATGHPLPAGPRAPSKRSASTERGQNRTNLASIT